MPRELSGYRSSIDIVLFLEDTIHLYSYTHYNPLHMVRRKSRNLESLSLLLCTSSSQLRSIVSRKGDKGERDIQSLVIFD
jgi:hypothetical protein